MSLFGDVTKLTLNRGIAIAFISFGNLIAPFWFLFEFDYPIVKELDFAKLVLACIAISAPITTIYSFFNPDEYYGDRFKNETEKFFSIISYESLSTSITFICPCFLTIRHHFTTLQGIYLCIYGGITLLIYKSIKLVFKYWDHMEGKQKQ